MPDVTIIVPEIEIYKKRIENPYFNGKNSKFTNDVSKTDMSMEKCGGTEQETSRPCTQKPSNSCLLFKKLSGASPYLGISVETSHLYHISRCLLQVRRHNVWAKVVHKPFHVRYRTRKCVCTTCGHTLPIHNL
jgi:hypothetical protein